MSEPGDWICDFVRWAEAGDRVALWRVLRHLLDALERGDPLPSCLQGALGTLSGALTALGPEAFEAPGARGAGHPAKARRRFRMAYQSLALREDEGWKAVAARHEVAQRFGLQVGRDGDSETVRQAEREFGDLAMLCLHVEEGARLAAAHAMLGKPEVEDGAEMVRAALAFVELVADDPETWRARWREGEWPQLERPVKNSRG